jgi:hypothetical protein
VRVAIRTVAFHMSKWFFSRQVDVVALDEGNIQKVRQVTISRVLQNDILDNGPKKYLERIVFDINNSVRMYYEEPLYYIPDEMRNCSSYH